MTQVRIRLKNLRMFAHHGIHPEEQRAGAEFEVNMEVSFPADQMIRSIDETIDYTRVEQVIRDTMSVPFPLLETTGMEIANRVKDDFPLVTEINITISKISAPLINFRGELSVSIIKRYEL